MMEKHYDRNSQEKTVKTAICFFWSNPPLVKQIAGFLQELGGRFAIAPYVVTYDSIGKLMFLKEGISSFTIEEILADFPDSHSFPIEDCDLDRLLQIDLLVSRFEKDSTGALYTHARGVLNAYAQLVRDLHPQVVFVWNGAAFWAGALAHVAAHNNIPCFFLERGFLPGTLAVDRKGVNYGSSIGGEAWKDIQSIKPSADDRFQLEAFFRSRQPLKQTVVAHGQDLTADEARQHLGVPPDSTIVLLPLQIETDSNIVFHSSLYKTMPEVIQGVMKFLESCNDVHLVIRPHPEDRDRVAELSPLIGPRCHFDTALSLPTLLACADVVVTINSNVGFEALVRRKPVVVLGKAIYGEKGFTFDLKAAEELPEQLSAAIECAQNNGFNEEAFAAFLIYLLKQHLFECVGEDSWNSRQIIGESVMAQLKSSEGRCTTKQSAWCEDLESRSRILMSLLAEDSGGRDRKALLLLDPSRYGDIFAHLIKSGRADMLGEFSVLRGLGLLWRGKYSIVLNEKANRSANRLFYRIWWSILRADRKITLN